MTNSKTTRRALLSSVVSLLLCFAMLIGTTFAWFTDSVSSVKNQIVAGNLDVELEYWNGEAWVSVGANTNVFEQNTLWEPGHTEVVYLKVSNLGTLALKYQLGVNIEGETTSTSVTGKDLTLSDFIYFGVVEGKQPVYETRDDARAAVETSSKLISEGYSKNSYLENQNDAEYIALVVYMPEWVGNDANYAKDAPVPTIDLGIKLFATQMMAEEDSFGNDYDADAMLPWDGSVDTVWYNADATEYVLYTAEELAGLSALVAGGNNFSGKTVKLGADIDLGDLAWTPIGRTINTGGVGENSTFMGNFDGQGNTVYNLSIDTVDEVSDTNKGAGLFGAITGNISNVNVVNATINTNHWAGAIAGSIEGSIDNCSVENVTITCLVDTDNDNGDKAGAIVGYSGTAGTTITNCSVKNATITAYRDLGAIAGASHADVTNNTVSNVTLIKDSTNDYKGTEDDDTVKAYVGRPYGTESDNTGDVTIVHATTVSDAETLATALTSDDKYIVVTLASDIAVPITSLGEQTDGSGEYKLGGEDTETITINLNDNELNITTDYWSAIGAKNDNAVFTIKNGSMTSTGNSATTWNAYDIRLCNCNYVIEDVTFDKAVALDNAGKSTKLTNVTITDDIQTDVYGLWITAEGQTVELDNVTIDTTAANTGRGIKIDEEYVAAADVKSVTLKVSNSTIKTDKKAAIMVKSAAGADITLSEVNIENTIDPVNEVWIDSDSAANIPVTVTGGTAIWEGNVVSSSAELTKAIEDGKTELRLLASEETYTVSGNSDIVIVGSGAGTVIDINGNIQKVNITNATVTGGDSLNVKAGDTIVFENVVFEGNVGMPAQGVVNGDATFTDCTFNAGFHIDSSAADANVEFDGCIFDEYAYIKLGGSANYSMNGCTIETISDDLTSPWGSQWLITYNDITLTDCTVGRVIRAGGAITITLDSCVDGEGAPVTDAIVHTNASPTVVIK